MYVFSNFFSQQAPTTRFALVHFSPLIFFTISIALQALLKHKKYSPYFVFLPLLSIAVFYLDRIEINFANEKYETAILSNHKNENSSFLKMATTSAFNEQPEYYH